ncbi:unnamed protein product [Ectocarpus sp. 12 AP-2014]
MPQSTNVLHWSSEARRQAAASALEAKRIAGLRQAGSAKVSTLPPKKDINGLMKIQKAHMSAAKMVAASRVSDGGLNDAGSSLVPTSDLALAFGASMDDLMSPAGGEDGDVDVSAISSTINRRPDLAAVGMPAAAAAYAIESVAGGGAVGIAPPPATSTPPPPSVAAAVAAAAAAAAAAVAALQPSPIPLSYTNPLGNESGGGAYDSGRGMGAAASGTTAYPGVGGRGNFPPPMPPPVPASSPPPPLAAAAAAAGGTGNNVGLPASRHRPRESRQRGTGCDHCRRPRHRREGKPVRLTALPPVDQGLVVVVVAAVVGGGGGESRERG